MVIVCLYFWHDVSHLAVFLTASRSSLYELFIWISLTPCLFTIQWIHCQLRNILDQFYFDLMLYVTSQCGCRVFSQNLCRGLRVILCITKNKVLLFLFCFFILISEGLFNQTNAQIYLPITNKRTLNQCLLWGFYFFHYDARHNQPSLLTFSLFNWRAGVTQRQRVNSQVLWGLALYFLLVSSSGPTVNRVTVIISANSLVIIGV